MSHITITQLARQIATAFATGEPCKIPLMTAKDLGRLVVALEQI